MHQVLIIYPSIQLSQILSITFHFGEENLLVMLISHAFIHCYLLICNNKIHGKHISTHHGQKY